MLSILQQLVDKLTIARNGHLGTGMIGTSFVLDVLAREGRNDLVAMMMAKKAYPSRGSLSEARGVTTWPETWTGWGSQTDIQVFRFTASTSGKRMFDRISVR